MDSRQPLPDQASLRHGVADSAAKRVHYVFLGMSISREIDAVRSVIPRFSQ
jgi:hypothetical protein